MYIPTQEERYSKVATLTLLLCLMVPSAVVAWLAGSCDLLGCITAFLQPLALLFDSIGFNATAAVCFSALFHAMAFWCLATAKRRTTPKIRLTIAVTWGMATALLLRVLLAFMLWRQLTGR